MGAPVLKQPSAERGWSAALGQRLKQARLAASLSRAEMASELAMSSESVRRWEQGGSKPSSAAVAAYLRVVGSDLGPLEQFDPEVDGGRLPTMVGQLIRRRRIERGLTQAEAAREIGVAQPTLAGWEIDRARPGRDLAAAIAEFIGEPLDAVAPMLRQPLTVEMANWPTFGRILGERRLTLQMDRNALAARMHVSARTVAAWELGEKIPNNSHLRQLAEVLDVAPAVLVSAIPERTPTSDLGRIIHRRQRLFGLSRDDIAAACAVTPLTVGRWIWGRNAPTDSSIELLARVLELDERVIRSAIDADASARPARG